VWVKSATSYATTVTNLPLIGEKTDVRTKNFKDICWAGNGITGPSFDTNVRA
jgi:hypothetical protein